MKCLSVRQPWAHAILALGKDVENRSWPTRYRGPLLIHAARHIEAGACRRLTLDPSALIVGHCLGIVNLVDCMQRSPSRWAIPGQWHWLLRNPRALPRPVPMAGRLGLFEVDIESLGLAASDLEMVASASRRQAAGGAAG